MKLQTKLFLALLLTSESLLIVFAVFFYHYVSPILIEREISRANTLNESFQEQIDGALEDLDTTSTNINYSSRISNQLNVFFNREDTSKDLNEIADLFVAINGTDLKADQINLYDLEGNVIRIGMVTNTIHIDLDDLDWFQTVQDLDGVKYIGQPYYSSAYSVSSSYPSWYISVYRTYKDSYGRNIGAIETVKRCKRLFKSIITYSKSTDTTLTMYIFNQDGKLVYPYDISSQDAQISQQYYETIKTSPQNCYITNAYTHEKEHFVYEQSTYSQWTYVLVQPESVILQPVNSLLSLMILVVGLLFILSICLAYILSQNLVKPLRHLQRIIQQMGLETLSVKASPIEMSYDELDQVHQAFEYMREKLKASMDELLDIKEQELKSRTLALQSQINPHFYYNTLSSIMILAEDGQDTAILSLCKDLTHIMRYITDTSSSIVSLSKEMDYVTKYLSCMKVRYQTSLDYDIYLAPDLLNLQVPKLLIQPLVENALKYGTNCIPPWKLRIKGYINHKDWYIDIIDSGPGFSKQALKDIQDRINFIDSHPGTTQLKPDGLGMMNVYIRWKLYTKDNFIFCYGNTPTNHGYVRIGQHNIF